MHSSWEDCALCVKPICLLKCSVNAQTSCRPFVCQVFTHMRACRRCNAISTLGADFKYRLSQTFLRLKRKRENTSFLIETVFAFFLSHHHGICVQLFQLFHTQRPSHQKSHHNLTTVSSLSTQTAKQKTPKTLNLKTQLKRLGWVH